MDTQSILRGHSGGGFPLQPSHHFFSTSGGKFGMLGLSTLLLSPLAVICHFRRSRIGGE